MDSDTTPAPAWQPVGPRPAHTLTLTIHAAPEGGFDVDVRCACPFPSRGHTMDGSDVDPATWHYGFAALYGADDDGRDLDSATTEALAHWSQHRESCARRFGAGALR